MVGPLISLLGMPSGARAAIPRSLTSGGTEMAGAGEEGRTDDVIGGGGEHAKAVTATTCASFLLLKDQKR